MHSGEDQARAPNPRKHFGSAVGVILCTVHANAPYNDLPRQQTQLYSLNKIYNKCSYVREVCGKTIGTSLSSIGFENDRGGTKPTLPKRDCVG